MYSMYLFYKAELLPHSKQNHNLVAYDVLKISNKNFHRYLYVHKMDACVARD
jgi:hypothetical protein